MIRHFPEEFSVVRKHAEAKGVGIALYMDEEFLEMENEEFFEYCLNNNIRDFITNAPSKSMNYKKRKISLINNDHLNYCDLNSTKKSTSGDSKTSFEL